MVRGELIGIRIAMAMAWLMTTASSLAQVTPDDSDSDSQDIAKLSIEELMEVKVISVSGLGEEWFRSPAAVYVITGEDVRRTGHRTLFDALRLAPGLFVGAVNSRGGVVGARGFSGGLANKTLVLIDGRTVYDPLFSGTFWDTQDVLLEDLDRIEVIRGPGATLWGANAVNGVINVITKHSRETQGLYISGGGGTFEQGFGAVRYGGKINDDLWFRIWGKYTSRDHFITSTGDSAHDDWDLGHGGFRFDLAGDPYTNFTLQGDIYSLRAGELTRFPVPGAHQVFATSIFNDRASGGNVLFRASQDHPDGHGWSLQTYYDQTSRVQGAGFQVDRDTADIDFRHHFKLGGWNELMWGVGYRYSHDETQDSSAFSLIPGSRTLDTVSAFVQDTITIIPNQLFGMIGSKFEHNDFTGFEFQPSARLWWTPDDRQMIWGAISRPVRVPSRLEQDGLLPFSYVDTGLAAGDPASGVIVPVGVTGDPDVDSEHLAAYEVGYRVKLTDDLTLDAAGFYNDYSRLIFVPETIIGSFNNDGWAETYGTEVAAIWRAAHNWRLEASYTFVRVQIHGPIFTLDEGNAPQHQVKIRSYLDITDNLEFNSALYYVDRLPAVDADAYFRLDLGLTWRPTHNLEISVWGQNLLDPSHNEASSLQAERAAYVQASLRF